MIPVKPPLGLKPEYIHEEQANLARVREILDAIDRYVLAGSEVPDEWLKELAIRARRYLREPDIDYEAFRR